MHREAAEAPQAVARQLAANHDRMAELAQRLRARPPGAVITFGRGSSDNAATYARYLVETRLGVVTASAPPSVSSVYEAQPDMPGMLCLAISQSGRSPDLLAAAEAAQAAGATVVALVNDAESPLAARADLAIPLHAGPELSVAATKSCLASFAAVAQLVALWAGDAALEAAVASLPETLARAWLADWGEAEAGLLEARDLYVLGRGVGYAAAQEAALKLKETCGLHAEAFSAAEVRHGPMALVGPGFPVLAFAQSDESLEGVEGVVRLCLAQGAQVFQAGAGGPTGAVRLPAVAAHPLVEPIGFLQSFYRMAAALATARGLDPDRPPHLNKITETF
ncbi:MAG: SIS domain-containing protein [Alphaproteobacteria bacterium]|nr:SIS domain-containing protein [Alphaproteobacteria bacterium]